MSEPLPAVFAGFRGSHVRPERPGAPPVVVVHGAFSQPLHFVPLLHFLGRAGFPAYAFPLRGRPGAPIERVDGASIADYAEDLESVLRALPDRAIVLGHSMGGLLAQVIAERGLARALVLLASAPSRVLTSPPLSAPYMIPMLPRVVAGATLPVPFVMVRDLVVNRLPEPAAVEYMATCVPESGRAYREMLTGAVRVDPRRVDCPVYVAGSYADRVISSRHIRWTARRLGGELKLYRNFGHCFVGEPGWERVAGEIVAWLRRTLGLGSRYSPDRAAASGGWVGAS